MDELELEALIERNYARIVRAAMVLCGNCTDAEDLAQETFLQAMRAKERFAGKSLPETWLYSILLNVHRKHQRSLARRWKKIAAWIQQHASSPPTNSLDSREWRESLWAIVAELPQVQQDAIVLRYSEGLTYDEIATATGCPVGTVRSRLHHGLKTLRKRFEEKPQALGFLETERS
ncbi:MAG: RNA polymerase sigma factor [Planctomycetes bacterium]|nr:RNA polymerase sigma factor [Planctomycetota bacterium]